MKKGIMPAVYIIAFILGIIPWIIFTKPKVFFTTKSPTGVYTVELTGDKTRPTFPLMSHSVNLNLFKNDESILENVYVYSGDLFDSDFNEAFPENKWENQSILRLGANFTIEENNSNLIVISNKTNRTIKYLKISSGDLFFFFGMPPNSKTEISAPLKSYISAVGEFENGKSIEYKGVNFLDRTESTSLGKTCISAIENSINIEHTIRNGYTGNNNSSSKNPDVPKVANCQ